MLDKAQKKAALQEIDCSEASLKGIREDNKKAAGKSYNHGLISEIHLQCKLSDLYLVVKKHSLSIEHVQAAIIAVIKTANVKILREAEIEGSYIPLFVLETAIRCWKYLRYTPKASSSVRINIAAERKQLLNDMLTLTDIYAVHQNGLDPAIQTHVNNMLVISAFVKESLGRFQESLSILSDLIAAQTVDGVDLSYVILKAALLLKHIGSSRYKQCIEYLEYLLEDPPTSESMTHTHVLAVLLLVYEQGGPKYHVLLSKHYKDLAESYHKDMLASSGQTGKEHDHSRSLHITETGSEVWESLTLQAVEHCQYTMACEFAHQAVLKAPNKPKLLHTLAELYYILGETEKAVKFGERALTLNPHSAELRNLLLLAAPETWTDKMRSAPSSEGHSEPNRKAAVSASKVVKVDASEDAARSSATATTTTTTSRSDEKQNGSLLAKAIKVIQSDEGGRPDSTVKLTPTVTEKTKEQAAPPPLFSLSFLSSQKPKPKASNKDKTISSPEKDSPIKNNVPSLVPVQETKDLTQDDGRVRVWKPQKPEGVNDPEVRRLIMLAMHGNKTIHYYDETLRTLSMKKTGRQRR